MCVCIPERSAPLTSGSCGPSAVTVASVFPSAPSEDICLSPANSPALFAATACAVGAGLASSADADTLTTLACSGAAVLAFLTPPWLLADGCCTTTLLLDGCSMGALVSPTFEGSPPFSRADHPVSFLTGAGAGSCGV